jgi:hypothetical protein
MALTVILEQDKKKVLQDHHDAYKIVKVDGGYAVFQTLEDFLTWKAQE